MGAQPAMTLTPLTAPDMDAAARAPTVGAAIAYGEHTRIRMPERIEPALEGKFDGKPMDAAMLTRPRLTSASERDAATAASRSCKVFLASGRNSLPACVR